MEANSVAGLSPPRQFRVGRNNVIKKKVWLPRQFQDGGNQTRFFREESPQDSEHFRG